MSRVPRWQGAVPAAVVAAALGAIGREPVLLVGAAVPLAYLVYGSLSTLPAPRVEIERRVSDAEPIPGDEVTVRLTVRNAGDRILPDVRVVDGVPDALAVVDGSPRACVALRPGDETTVEYAVRARRGTHDFDRPALRVRSLAGASVRTEPAAVDGDGTVRCRLFLEEFPLSERTIQYVGPTRTPTGGSGVEFHATREYRPGDPINRIDWRRLARTGDLTTVEFRESRAATVVLLLDDREAAAVAPGPGSSTALELSAYAARRALTVLLGDGNRVGVGTLADPDLWADPGADAMARHRAERVLDAVTERDEEPAVEADAERGESDGDGRDDDGGAAGDATDGDAETDGRRAVADGGEAEEAVESSLRRIRQRLTGREQVVLLSPAVDETPLEVVRTLRADGHAVTVVSPDPTADGTPGGRIARIRRGLWHRRMQTAGARVVDWAEDAPLGIALADALGPARGGGGR